jgi:hypothetical protein
VDDEAPRGEALVAREQRRQPAIQPLHHPVGQRRQCDRLRLHGHLPGAQFANGPIRDAERGGDC